MSLRKQDGFTIVETLVAAVIATMIAYASFSVFPFLRKNAAVGRGAAACKSYLATNFSRIENLGTSPRIKQPMVATTTDLNSAAKVPMQSPFMGMTDAQLSPSATMDLVGLPALPTYSADLADIRTAGLYMSSMTLVNALYANNASICSSGLTIPGAMLDSTTTMSPPPPDIADQFQIAIQIVPFDLLTRQLKTCTSPGFQADPNAQIAPKGLSLTKTQMENRYIAKSTARNNVGYEVTLTASYVADGANKQCVEKRRVEYTADLVAPAPPAASFTYNQTASVSYFGPRSAEFIVRYNGEEGAVLICRDRSTFTAQNTYPSKSGVIYVSDAVVPSNAWVPCDKVTACGRQAAAGAGLEPSPTSGNYGIHVRWNQQLPYGCTARIEAVSVDPAGNVSSSAEAFTPIIDPYAGP